MKHTSDNCIFIHSVATEINKDFNILKIEWILANNWKIMFVMKLRYLTAIISNYFWFDMSFSGYFDMTSVTENISDDPCYNIKPPFSFFFKYCFSLFQDCCLHRSFSLFHMFQWWDHKIVGLWAIRRKECG